jgi:hypothetical protein
VEEISMDSDQERAERIRADEAKARSAEADKGRAEADKAAAEKHKSEHPQAAAIAKLTDSHAQRDAMITKLANPGVKGDAEAAASKLRFLLADAKEALESLKAAPKNPS